MTLEHIGIALATPEQEALFRRLLDTVPYKTETVEREGVSTLFFGDGGVAGGAPKLELLTALREDSPVATFVSKRGPGLHHLAFEVEDLEAEMVRVRDAGFRLLADAPKPGADGKRIVFLHPKDTAGVLVELVEAALPPTETLAVPFEGGRLAAEVSGKEDGPPLVVLHGALDSIAGATAPLIRQWRRTFHVYALDFMGHGASDAFDFTRLSTDAFVGNVLTLLDTVELETAYVFGYSTGGAVALHLAALHPSRVRRLAVFAAHVQWSEEEEVEMGALADAALAAPDGPWQRGLAVLHGEERWQPLVRQMREFENGFLSDEELADVQHPSLILCGDRDMPFLLRQSIHLRSALPHATLGILPGDGHDLSALDTKALARTVTDFLLGD